MSITLFSESVRAWPHPGITTDLRSREDYNELEKTGNAVMEFYLSKGLSVRDAGQLAYQEVMGNHFSFTEEISETPFITDRVCYEEACDYVEQNWVSIPLFSLHPKQFIDMIKRIHQHIIDPQHPGLKGLKPGCFRDVEEGEMVVFKNSADCGITLHQSIENRKKGSPKTVCRDLESIETEIRKFNKYTYYEMITQKIVSPATLTFLNDFLVVFPPNKQVLPLVEKMVSQLLTKLTAFEENKINKMCTSTALSVEEMIITGKFCFKTLDERVSEAHEDAVSIAAFAHLEFVRVHPLPEANGRVARTLMNLALMQGGHQPLSFPYCKPYLAAIRQEDAGRIGAFDTFLRKRIKESVKIPIYVAQNKR